MAQVALQPRARRRTAAAQGPAERGPVRGHTLELTPLASPQKTVETPARGQAARAPAPALAATRQAQQGQAQQGQAPVGLGA